MKGWIAPLFLLTACMHLQGPYVPPAADVAENWKNPAIIEEDIDLDQWWNLFHDPVLTDYALVTVQNNQTIEAAYRRMTQAFYVSKSKYGALFPEITLNPIFFKQGFRPFRELSNVAATPLPFERLIISEYILPLSFNWQLDIWGQLTQTYLNAFYNFQNSYFKYSSTINQITSDVAVNYYVLRGFDSEIEVLNKVIQLRKENLELNQFRYEAGLTDYLNVTRAQVDVASAESERENVIRERNLQENIIAVLQAIPPSDFKVLFAPIPIDEQPPQIPAYFPCELIFRRPDILAAERNIAALHANMGVAYANFFPSLTLFGTIGYASPTLDSLFDWKSRLWQEAAFISQIVFNGGQLNADLKASIEAYYEAISLYEDAVLTGIREVEDALSNIRQRAVEEDFLIETFRAAEETYLLAKDRFESGFVDYLDVVVAERDLLNSARSAAVVHAQRFVDAALLIKALGGGWEKCQ